MNTRSFLLLLIGLLAFMVYLEWQKDYASPPRPAAESGQTAERTNDTGAEPASADPGDVPDVPDFADDSAESSEVSADVPAPQPEIRASRRITIGFAGAVRGPGWPGQC